MEHYDYKLDVSNWWKECQNDSRLASDCMPDDVLLLLFDRLTARESIPLGLTCRRLYYHLKDAQKKTRELKLISKADSDKLPKGDFKIGYFCAFAPSLLTTYPNLRSLSLTSSSHPDNIATLFTAVLPKLPLLTSLSLTAKEFDIKCRRHFALTDHFWRPLAALQSHASLRHLKISLLEREKEFAEPFAIPALPILRQLSSFTFGSDVTRLDEHTEVFRALSKEEHGVHLTPGVGARIELLIYRRCFTLDDSPSPIYIHVSTNPLLLPYLTLLDVDLDFDPENPKVTPKYQLAVATLFRFLPQMRQLRKLKMTIFSQTDSTDYPALLAALSTLTTLRTLSIQMDWNPSFQLDWTGLSRTSLPALPSVHHLSLNLWRTDHRWDVVKRLRLVHVFPEICTLKCTFHHYLECNKRFGGNPQYRRCAQELARGVVELLPDRIEKKMEFNFDNLLH